MFSDLTNRKSLKNYKKMHFISSKKLFSFSDIEIFVFLSSPLFPVSNLKQQMIEDKFQNSHRHNASEQKFKNTC